MTDEQDQIQQHPPSWSSIFGESDGPSMITDDPRGASPRSSAMAMAKRRQKRDREAQQERDLVQLQTVAQEEADARDLDQALKLYQAGKKVPGDVLRGAMRANKRRGGERLSSAELLAMGHGK